MTNNDVIMKTTIDIQGPQDIIEVRFETKNPIDFELTQKLMMDLVDSYAKHQSDILRYCVMDEIERCKQILRDL